MPDDNSELADVEVSFPQLSPNDLSECPETLDALIEYLRLESPDFEQVKLKQLTFLRTALVAERRYWIWAFLESNGTECYATVSLDEGGTTTLGYASNDYELTPDQYLLGDYHNVF